MSESSKMGLFGSKDDNTGAGSNEDGKTEPTKAKENSPARYNAPYNIDSDSETYDTEALSIMDINDIIGVQAESAGDSTLESEFAALSEVITDCKGEFSSKIGGAIGSKDKAADTSRNIHADDKKPSNSAGIASMSKSLQLIGEAYISEDSQETDTEETPESTSPKAAGFNKCLKGSKSDTKDAEILEKTSSNEAVPSSSKQTAGEEETSAVPCTSDLKEESVVKKIVEEPQNISEETPKSPQIDKSVDSTDSVNAVNSTNKPNEKVEIESMDVDRSPPENIVETAIMASQSESKIETEDSKKNEVSNDPQVDCKVTETEEPMEVDQVSDEISPKDEFASVEGATGKPEELLDSLAQEESKVPSENDIVRSDESNKCIDEISADVSTGSQQEDIDKSGTAIESDESHEVLKVVDEEPTSSVEITKNEETGTEKLEAKIVDELNEKTVAENLKLSNPVAEIGKPIGESSSAIENIVGALPEKDEEPEERPESPQSPQKVAIEVEKEASSLVREAVDGEPMEVDDNLTNEQPESQSDEPVVAVSDLSKNNIYVVESVSDISLKGSTVESGAAEPESSQNAAKIAESVRVESSPDASSIERTIDEPTVTAVPEKSSITAEADEHKCEEPTKLEENTSDESITSATDLSEKCPSATLQVYSTPEVETIVPADEESIATAADAPEKFQTETAQVDSTPEVVSMETENEVSFGTVIDSREKSAGETVRVHSTPEVDSKESAIEESLAPADESSDKSSPIVERSRVESTTDTTSNEFTVTVSTEYSAEDEKMEVDGGKIEKREEEENAVSQPETASQRAEQSPATFLPEVCTTEEEESTVGKAGESDVQEIVDASSAASPEVAETDKIVEESIEVLVQASTAIIPENDTETRGIDIVDEVPHDDEDDNEKDSNAETECPIITETAESTGKSGEVEAEETSDKAAKEDEEDKSEPEAIEENTPETLIAVEAEKTLADAAADAKNEETEAMEEPSLDKDAAVRESISTEQTIQDEIVAQSSTEEKSVEDPAGTVESDVDSVPKTSSDAVSSSITINPSDTDEYPVEDMNLSLVAEITESHEEAQPVDQLLPSQEIATNPEEEIKDDVKMNLSLETEEKIKESRSFNTDVVDKTSIGDRTKNLSTTPTPEKPDDRQAEINLLPEPEEKVTQLPRILTEEAGKTTVEDCMEESSMTSTADKIEESEERIEKSCEDIDEDSKDVEPTSMSVPEMFHDEQSQTTQEMMESILETDTGNLNKILDAEEAEGEALARSNALPLEPEEIDEMSDKLPSESEELLNKELDDPMSSQNIDSLEGLLDLDLIPENDESALKVVEPIVEKVMSEAEEDIGTNYMMDVTEQAIEYAGDVPKAVEDIAAAKEIVEVVDIVAKSVLDGTSESMIIPPQLESAATELIDNDIDADFALTSVPDPLEDVPLVSEETKIDLAEDLLREIAVEEERKMKLAEQLFLEGSVTEETKIDLLLETAVQGPSKIDIADEVETDRDDVLADPVLLHSAVEAEKNIVLADPILLQAVVPEDSKIELSEDIDLESAVQDQVLTDVATEIEDFAPTSEISELESAVKFLQESVEQDIDSPLVLSPKLVESVVEDIAQESDGAIFVAEPDICDDPSELVAELENIIPDPIAISEAEIISEAAKLESERKTKEEAKLQSPIVDRDRSPSEIDSKIESPISNVLKKPQVELCEKTSPLPAAPEPAMDILTQPESPKTHGEPRESAIAESPVTAKIEDELLLKKSVPIPKMSILEERLKIPPKIEIPVGEVSRICEMPTTPKTSLLIQRDAKLASYQKMLESPKSSEKTELKIVDTPRKDSEKYDFENVGSPRIILKIAKSAIADCGEPRSPKSPKIRSATNSPNPEDSPGQKLGKIKLKLSKSGHPSIIPNDNVEEVCGQWHTEGTSSLSPLGMKIKFSKTGDPSIVQAEKHEATEDPKEQPKHKFEEAKRTESPIGMKIKLSRTGDPSIVQQDGKESTSKHKDKMEIMQGSPKRTESPIGMKIKLSKSGDASIIQPDKQDLSDEHKEASRSKDKLDVPQDVPRRTESPLGMKIKLFKTGDASIVQSETVEDSPQDLKRTDSPLGMKIKLSKTRGGASILPADGGEEVKDKLEGPDVPRRTESPLGMKIKLSKSGDASIIHSEDSKESSKNKERTEACQDSMTEASLGVKIKVTKPSEVAAIQPEIPSESEVRTSSIGMKIKLSKTGDASIVHSDVHEQSDDSRGKERLEKIDSSIGMKIKLSKTGDASIIHNPKKSDESTSADVSEMEHKKIIDTALGVKIKLPKSGEASVVETEKKEKPLRRKDTEMPLEMKIKLSKTGHPTIVACENYGEQSQRLKESVPEASAHAHKHKETSSPKENPGIKMMKSMHSANLHGGRSELTIEPIQSQNRKNETTSETSPKRKDVTISPIESKKAKLEDKLSQMLPEVTIQPITPRDPKKMMLDPKASPISRQQMNVISQEISITQVRPNKPMDLSMTDKLKSMLANVNASTNSDCEIIERHPELIIVNENSNSSQDVMIIEEVPALRGPDAKIPKKRGRPRRNPVPLVPAKPLPDSFLPAEPVLLRDPLALDDVTHVVTEFSPQNLPPKENERPKRTCSRQKSYAPPRRGRRRGGGRGKRKMEMSMDLVKKPRIEQDLDMIERSTTALITIDETPSQPNMSHNTSELYKALRQPPMDSKMVTAMVRVEADQTVNDANLVAKSRMESLMDSRLMSHLGGVMETTMNTSTPVQSFSSDRTNSLVSLCGSEGQVDMTTDHMDKRELLAGDEKLMEKVADDTKDGKDVSSATDHQNWLTPSSKRQLDGRNDGNISNVQVIDEETRMSAESVSRSQTPARNMSVQASETIVNEESQGSVLSTATTESEKVKVKNRRMEINFDPDEGPFTVDKIAEYEWPPDPSRKSETFMIQEQISQYLGVKSFKRKYPELKRRMVDMEERNFLRENGLVSESMCDMGLTAVSSSEVLDVMCNDFPDQYEEYRKYIREKQMKEHSKKQKELTAAANAERNRIDLAEMAVQSALSWNVGLNKARRESRKCSLDLQTFTIHVPKKQQKVEEESKVSHYPVALIPGQYTDYYREYTPAELRYYPLNTVLYGPMKPNERKFDSQSEGSQSDSDSDSSSDDSSSSSSDGTQDTEESQSTMDEVDVELSRQKEDIKTIKCKMCLKHLNKFSRIEVLIQCGTCNGYVHPSCIDLTLDMVPHIQAYAWQCTDCKTCAQCHDPADEDKMLFCDMCDRGYHIYCVGLRRVPQGRWHCQECAVCASCGSREAGGANSDRNSVAQWQHEYKKGDKNTRVYVSTLCVPCSKLWRKGRYCPHCSRCHTVPRLDLEANLVHCSACDKYLHLGCVETKDLTIDRKNYLCDFCQPSRQQMVKPLVSKVFRT